MGGGRSDSLWDIVQRKEAGGMRGTGGEGGKEAGRWEEPQQGGAVGR